MFNVDHISEGHDSIIAYKIVERRFVDNIIKDGQIYFGLLKNYRKMETENMHAIGDGQEAALTTKIAEYLQIDGTYIEFHGPNAGNNSRISAGQCAFCFYLVGLKSCTKKSPVSYSHILPYSVIKTICADKGGVDNCVLLLFDANVVQKIYSALKHKGLYFGARRIIYDNFEYIPEHDITSKAYALECTFHKSEEYSYQNEFRISVLNTQDAPITDLYIDVSPDDFNVLELKENHDLCCSVELEITHTGCNHATLGIHSTYELMPCRDTSFDTL